MTMPSTKAEGRQPPSIDDWGKDNYGALAAMAATTATVAKATVTAAATTKKETWWWGNNTLRFPHRHGNDNNDDNDDGDEGCASAT